MNECVCVRGLAADDLHGHSHRDADAAHMHLMEAGMRLTIARSGAQVVS